MPHELRLAGTACALLLEHGEEHDEVWDPVSDTRFTDKGITSPTLPRAQRRAPEPAAGDAAVRDSAPVAPRHSRRLSDKILIAFHHACDQADLEIADQLLRIIELMLVRRPVAPDGNRRRSIESLVAAHERLWHLRHPSDEQY